MGKFSAEEIAKRTARLMAVRHLGTAAMIAKGQRVKSRREAIKAEVRELAKLGVFVPIQKGE